jgi:hypothetical protein
MIKKISTNAKFIFLIAPPEFNPKFTDSSIKNFILIVKQDFKKE